MKRYSKLVCTLLSLIVIAMLLSACVQKEIELEFYTIEQAKVIQPGMRMYEEQEPALVVIASREEIGDLDNYVSPEGRDVIARLNFSTYLVIAVFHGMSTYDYDIRIKRVTYQDAVVKIYAEFIEPHKGQVLHPTAASPYQIIAVEKPEPLAGKEVHFVLIANEKRVTSVTHRIP